MMAMGIDVGDANRKVIDKQKLSGQISFASKLLMEYPGRIVVPTDVALNKDGERIEVEINKIPNDFAIADNGSQTISYYSKILEDARLSVFHGPTGIFEIDSFKIGTIELLKAAIKSTYSIAGGGHTLEVIDQLGLGSKFSHLSMGGGASITYLSGEPLPVIDAIKKAAARTRKT
jgi:phosphoglycerate kinase